MWCITHIGGGSGSCLDVPQAGGGKVWLLDTPPSTGQVGRHCPLHKSDHLSNSAAVRWRVEGRKTSEIRTPL